MYFKQCYKVSGK